MTARNHARKLLHACVACAALLASCGDEPVAIGTDAPPEGGTESAQESAAVEWRTATSRAGRYEVSWRPSGGPIPLNEQFELEVRVASAADGAPIINAQVSVIAEMPEHGHGMNREPRSTEEGDGLYRVRGMLMHMTGRWVLSIDVIVASVSESTDFEVVVE